MKKIAHFVLLLVLLSGFFGSDKGEVAAAVPTSEAIAVSRSALSFSIQDLTTEIVIKDGIQFTGVSLTDVPNSGIPGSPDLPVQTLFFAAPIGAEAELVVESGSPVEILLNEPVIPAPTASGIEPAFSEDGEPESNRKQTTYKPNPDIYENQSLYPTALAEISNDGMMRNQRVVAVNVFPIQYDPANQRLLAYESLVITLHFKGGFASEAGAANLDSPDFEQLFGTTLENHEQGLRWRASQDLLINSGELIQTDPAAGWAPPQNSWRIEVSQTGTQSITQAALAQAGGLPADANPRNFQMFHNGAPIDIMVTGESDGSFDAGDSVLFYGEKLLNKYSNKNVYWLTLQTSPGTRMITKSVNPGSAPLKTTLTKTAHFESNKVYRSRLQGSDQLERFTWQQLSAQPGSPVTWTTTVNLPDATNASATLKMSLYGISSDDGVNPDHQVIVSLNGTVLGEIRWDGETPKVSTLPIPNGVLTSGSNSLTFNLPAANNTYDFVHLDWFEVQYAANTIAVSNQIEIQNPETGQWKYQITGFTSGDISGLDTTDPDKPLNLSGITVTNQSGAYQAAFQDNTTGEASYFLQTSTQYQQPQIVRDAYSTLRSTGNGADFIVISHANFKSAGQTLANYRQNQGMRTLVVDVQDVYDEFSYGQTRAIAIRDFLAFAYQNWVKPAPTYALLLGDGNYDPNHYLSTSGPSWVPSYLGAVDPLMVETAADNHFVSIVGGDKMPDMMLGRLPVNTLTEAQQAVSKITGYETQPLSGNWYKNVLFAADNADQAGNFSALSDTMLQAYKPNNHSVQKAYLDINGNADVVRGIILNAINGADTANPGLSLANYFGHADEYQWAHENILRNTNVSALTNSGKLPFVVSMDCWDSYFIKPRTDMKSLNEAFMLNPTGGGIAVYGATGESLATGHEHLDRGLLRSLYQRAVKTLGQTVISSKLTLWGMGYNLDLMDTYMLTGDAATVFKRGLTAAFDHYITNINQPLVVSAADGVMANDLNPQNLPGVTAVQVGALTPNLGSLEFNPDGSFRFTPNSGVFGRVTFTYQLQSGSGEISNLATVYIEIYPPNNIPSDINYYSSGLYENYPIGWKAGYFLTVDADSNDYHTYQLVSGAGSEDNDSFGIDREFLTTAETFNYEVKNQYHIRVRTTDNKGGWFEKAFVIDIGDLNDAPVANDDFLTAPENSVVEIPFAVLLANDTDEDDDPLSISSVLNPVNGTVEIIGDKVVFTPNPGGTNQARFDYQVYDGMYSDQATVTISFGIQKIYLPVILYD